MPVPCLRLLQLPTCPTSNGIVLPCFTHIVPHWGPMNRAHLDNGGLLKATSLAVSAGLEEGDESYRCQEQF
jgi:hypothetical protein